MYSLYVHVAFPFRLGEHSGILQEGAHLGVHFVLGLSGVAGVGCLEGTERCSRFSKLLSSTDRTWQLILSSISKTKEEISTLEELIQKKVGMDWVANE